MTGALTLMGVAHGDVRPGNIVITPNRESAFLVNFGIALSQADALLLTKSRAWFGTSEHLRSEHGSEPADPASDLYSLGSTIYEALSGKRIRQGQYEELSPANPIIPWETDGVLRGCLEPRHRRIASVKEFRRQLKSAVAVHRSRRWYPEIIYSGKAAEAYAWREYEARLQMGRCCEPN
jgi:serine/threonine protein kinase